MIASLLLALGAATPAPAATGAPDALAPPPEDRNLYEAWATSVASEACTPGPASTPAPAYPAKALRLQASGRVVLALFTNRCGDVRDAWVAESSGNADIDRAAVRAARAWKLPPRPDGAAAGHSRVAIDFDFGPDA